MNASRKALMVAAAACILVMSAASAQDVAEIKVLGSRTTVKVKPAVDGVNPSPLYKTLELSYGVNAGDLDLKSDSARRPSKNASMTPRRHCARRSASSIRTHPRMMRPAPSRPSSGR